MPEYLSCSKNKLINNSWQTIIADSTNYKIQDAILRKDGKIIAQLTFGDVYIEKTAEEKDQDWYFLARGMGLPNGALGTSMDTDNGFNLIVGTDNGRVYQLNYGDTKWVDLDLNATVKISSVKVMSDTGEVYATGSNGKIYVKEFNSISPTDSWIFLNEMDNLRGANIDPINLDSLYYDANNTLYRYSRKLSVVK